MVEPGELADGDVAVVVQGTTQLLQVGIEQDLDVALAEDGEQGNAELPQEVAGVEREERAEPGRRQLFVLLLENCRQ